MTTMTLQGLRVDYDTFGDPFAAGSSETIITYPENTTAFSYALTGVVDDGVPEIDIITDVYSAFLDGQSADDLGDNNELTSFIAQVTWSAGVTTILGFNFETTPGNEAELYYVLNGPIPNVNSLASWTAFENSITDVGAPSGAFGPGQQIAWTSFVDSSFSEDDDIYGTDQQDTLSGGKGDDYFRSSDGADDYDGGRGKTDQISFKDDPSGIVAHLGNGTAIDGWGNADTLTKIEWIRGSLFDDKMTGDGKANTLRGLAGDDTVKGGGGLDTVRYDRDERYGGSNGVTIDLKNGTAIDGFGDTDKLASIENAIGTAFDDIISGDKGKNKLSGLEGNDIIDGLGGKDKIDGGSGRDTIDGGAGNDTITGGNGADEFVFSGSFGDDRITDFDTSGKKEKIDLSDAAGISRYKDLKNNHLSEDANGDVVITDKNGNTITLIDIEIADLSGNDFIF